VPNSSWISGPTSKGKAGERTGYSRGNGMGSKGKGGIRVLLLRYGKGRDGKGK